MIFIRLRDIVYLLTILLFVSCSKPESIIGKIDGAWETQWEDYIGEDDVEDIRVTEVISFETDAYNSFNNMGSFVQIFIGEVEYDDWEYEETLEFEVVVNGIWSIRNYNNIDLDYDLQSINIATGKCNIEVDYTSAAIDLLMGNYLSAIATGIKGMGEIDKVNEKINNKVYKQIQKFFKDYIRDLKHNRPAMKKIEIERDVMNCTINTGWLGRDAVYDFQIYLTTE